MANVSDDQKSVGLPPLLTISEVKQILKVSRSMAYKLVQEGEIRSIRLGRLVRVSLEDLKLFIQTNTSVG